jgi:hypothetical protein
MIAQSIERGQRDFKRATHRIEIIYDRNHFWMNFTFVNTGKLLLDGRLGPGVRA